MSSRLRDTSRHYASGSAKRKAKNEKEKKNEAVLSKTRKLSEFFNVQKIVAESTETEAENKEGSSYYTYKSETETFTSAGTLSTSDFEIEKTTSPPSSPISCFSQRKSENLENPLDSKSSYLNQTKVDSILDDSTATFFSSKKLNESKIYSNDIGERPSNFDRDYWIAKGSSELQHIKSDFSSSKKMYEKGISPRFCQKSFFTYNHKPTNKTHIRNWLCYSETKGRLFCFVCKVIDSDTNQSARFTKDGFLSQIETELNYWQMLLKRIIAVIKFLAERGLAFRGSNEIVGSIHNGNNLGLLELLSEFDVFMAQHIQTYAHKGKGHTSYLSKTTCEEFIKLIASSMLNQIICEIKRSKYYSVSLDSTPGISHVDETETHQLRLTRGR